MDRNKRIGVVGIIFFMLLILAAAFGQKQTEKNLTSYTATFFELFNTRTDIKGYSESEEKFAEQVTLLKEKLEYYHQLYDIYNDYEGINNIKTINDNAGVAPVKVSQDIIDLLLFSKEMYYKTNGQINVAMGSVLKIWHEYREEGRNNPAEAKLPAMEKLEEASIYCDIEQIIIDEEAMTVYLPDEHMSIDVGSIGKGYAVQRLVEYAKEIGVESALFDVGCNISAIGEKPNGKKWRVGIQNPDTSSEDEHVNLVDVSDVCIVTSGDYERYYMVDGVRYCHIIDGDTLMPADYFPAVSIITKDSGIADALSTSVFNMPLEEGLAFVNSLEDVEAMWVLKDGSLVYSDGFMEYVAR